MNTQSIVAVALQAGLRTLIYSHPGNGKTSFFEALCAATGKEYIPRYPVRETPLTAGGAMVPVVETGELKQFPADWLVHINGRSDVGVVLEELTSSPAMILATYMQFLANGTMGCGDSMCEVGEGAFIAATCNPRGSAANYSPIPPPVANRLCHLEWETDASVVARGFKEGWPSTMDIPILPDGWRDSIPWSKAMVGAYLGERPAMCHVYPDDRAAQSGPWPSPRSWEQASIAIAAMATLNKLSQAEPLVAGCVGDAAAADFFVHMDMEDMPSRSEIAAGIKAGRMDLPRRADKVDAVMGAAFQIVKEIQSNSPNEAVWKAAVKFFANCKREAGYSDAIYPYVLATVKLKASPSWRAAPEDISAFEGLMEALNQPGA